jgi:hypothetical protein
MLVLVQSPLLALLAFLRRSVPLAVAVDDGNAKQLSKFRQQTLR